MITKALRKNWLTITCIVIYASNLHSMESPFPQELWLEVARNGSTLQTVGRLKCVNRTLNQLVQFGDSRQSVCISDKLSTLLVQNFEVCTHALISCAHSYHSVPYAQLLFDYLYEKQTEADREIRKYDLNRFGYYYPQYDNHQQYVRYLFQEILGKRESEKEIWIKAYQGKFADDVGKYLAFQQAIRTSNTHITTLTLSCFDTKKNGGLITYSLFNLLHDKKSKNIIEEYQKLPEHITIPIVNVLARLTKYTFDFGILWPLLSILEEPGFESTLLIRACEYGMLEVAQFLIDHGVDVNAQDSVGNTALHMNRAYCAKGREFTEMLLNAGADPSIKNKSGQTALDFFDACEADMTGAVKQLLDSDRSLINKKDHSGDTCLHKAACHNDTIATVQLLLQYGADANVRNNFEETPLHACYNDDVLQLLIDNGAIVNAYNNTHETPLHGYMKYGTRRNDLKYVLLMNNADIYARDKIGASPYTLSQKKDIAKDLSSEVKAFFEKPNYMLLYRYQIGLSAITTMLLAFVYWLKQLY